MSVSSTHALEAGTLAIDVTDEAMPDLFQIAERENPKRAFLFVSTVLGRHIPVAPQAHTDVIDRLCDVVVPRMSSGGFLLMSYAETAIGLGLGVFRALAGRCPDKSALYLPTTRSPVAGRDIWFEITEPHSHAAEHIVMRPDDDVPQGTGTTLVLVDDETTTGKTFENLAVALFGQGLEFEKILLVTLCDWSSGEAEDRLRAVLPGVEVASVSLLQGRWRWTAKPGAPPASLPDPVPPACPLWVSRSKPLWGVPRLGVTPHSLAASDRAVLESLASAGIPKIEAGQSALVIGTGEHAWQPFLVSEALAARGVDASFITTTRSPVRCGDVVQTQIVFPDHYGIGVAMYLNNVDPKSWDHILLFTETGHDGIPEALRTALGQGWAMDGAGHVWSLGKGAWS